jgi:hypothetical protein
MLLQPGDEDIRGLLTRSIAERGFGPSLEDLATASGRSNEDVEAALRRLGDAHALLLHPGTAKPWVVHPFALAPGSCWVETAERGYWASCLYCAFGILTALRRDGVVTTRFGGEAETARFEVRDGTLVPSEGVFHLSTPVAAWWDNVIFACASFQPFRRVEDIDPWCARHALPRGTVLSLPALFAFARDWYGDYLSKAWRKRSADEVRALFARHGLEGAFWAVK